MTETTNLGIVAHVDAGKTSLTELLLHTSGMTRQLGSVDKGTSQTDWLEVERRRGISIRSASVNFRWNNRNVNIIDTPGHVDFSSEVERAMRVMDCAILVISAVEGIQSHTETLWEALGKLKIPTLLFINKVDRAGADTHRLIQDIRDELSQNILIAQTLSHEGEAQADIANIYPTTTQVPLREEIIEAIVNQDDKLLAPYLNDERIEYSNLRNSLTRQIKTRQLFPIFFGSAKYNIGIQELLNGITDLMPTAFGDSANELSGLIYKIEHDKTLGKVASVRLFEGSLKNRDLIVNSTQQIEEKISQIKKLQGQKLEDVGKVEAGDTAAICGLNRARAGDILGNPAPIPDYFNLTTPLLTVKVSPKNNNDYTALVNAMQLLSDEDPTLELIWLKEERELHIKIIGLIQLEILEALFLDRFQLPISFGQPTIIYKETPLNEGECFEAYTMPKPCWALVGFHIEPGVLGSGVTYSSLVGVNNIAARYQQEIERTLPVALQQGPLGWEVTDLHITLIKGEHHHVHSRAGDFAIATPMAIMNGLQNTGTLLLEPILSFNIKAPANTLGKIASSLTQRRADFGNPQLSGDRFYLEGTIPVATSLDYSTKISVITSGKGLFRTTFHGYRPCPLELGQTTEYRGINPLDRAKYILKARKALQ